ncbi:Outer membrane protein assembly factor BamB, contains PQQ-like beta-propeller repeat [Halogranum amylolyticum]|uniref:Outer membrane protein assembly factor BamB, contains PQQ-like beta-propeller repeat n=2 Tax=Halogranum amylolyticum TaxID=660520 RepID=A0A1H8WNK1_9EURY|nr:Outer membrane protein assembly factor BamB, contains PQQ-like beta-propeller repeat [Halogranum amylolyticum]
MGYHIPIVGDDTVYVHNLDTTLFAFAADTGDERWRTPLEGPGPAPTLGGGRLVVATENGLKTFDAASGEQRWTVETPAAGVFDSPPVIAHETVYFYGGVGVSAFDLADGSLQWRVPIGLASDSAPAVGDDTLYVAGDDTYLRALSTVDGSERWRQKTAAHIDCNVAVAGETVYAGSESGTVLACDRADGAKRWQYSLPTDEERQRTPQMIATDGARVYVTTDDVLYALDSKTGRPCWTIDTHRRRYSSGIAIGDGTLFVPTEDSDSASEPSAGAVYNAANGERLRGFATDAPYGFDGGPSVAGGAVYTNGRAALRRYSAEETGAAE